MRFVFGECELEPESRTLQRRGERVPVEPKVFDLIAYLIERRERVVSTDELLDALWPGVSVTPAALSRTVQKARRAVGDDGEHQAVLRTEHGHGFRFVAEVREAPAPEAAERVSEERSATTQTGRQPGLGDFAGRGLALSSRLVAAGAVLLALVLSWLVYHWGTEATPIRSIAVLPLANLSGDSEQEYFADGMTEALIGNLSKIGALRVISRTSAMHYKYAKKPLPEIARELDVEAILEGSVLRSKDRVRITAQLIDAETDSHLWSETYDRALSDIFAVQDEIAASVGEAMKVALLGADASPIRQSPETSIEIYSDYLLARHRFRNPSYANFTDAVDLLESVIARDPKYAPAYTSLAEAYRRMAAWGMLPLSDAAMRMKPVVEQALSLDDQQATAWYCLAFIRKEDGDLDGARAAWKRALEVEPQGSDALRSQMIDWLSTHEPERGLENAAELLRADPLSTNNLFWIAALYRRLGRFDDAQKIVARMLSIDPHITTHLTASWVLADSVGDLVTALKSNEELAKIEVDDPEVPSIIARIYLDLGDVSAAEYWKDVAAQINPGATWVKLVTALIHLDRGEEDRAVAIARELAQPDSHNRHAIRGIALRIVLAADLVEGNYEDVITRYLTLYPELDEGVFPIQRLRGDFSWVPEAFLVTLNLASIYVHAGEDAKADSLLSLIESELPHWPTDIVWGHGFANAELHALRGEKNQALAALREDAARGMRYLWRWQLLHNPILESIRDSPEFSAIVAEIEADMAAQLERVREMERRGELPLPTEQNAPTDRASNPSPTDHQ
jgi:TolB-like protein/DNA-binding winged helix-turn-helix (wHTH) protein/cytochrome c-type biogenesis protein CcmH/NrfG